MNNNLYPLIWLLKTKLTKHPKPLIAINFITEQCELACIHCSFAKKHSPYIKSYSQIETEFEYCLREGVRHLYIDGGEPLLWREGEYNLQSLVDLSKRMGFHRTAVFTSAWEPFEKLKADEIIVSLDGIGRHHEELRGKGTFKRMVEHVNASKHRNVNSIMTINAKNHRALEETVRFTAENPHFRRIYINFHTPFRAGDDLVLDENLQASILDRVIALKSKGYPVANSISALKLMAAGIVRNCLGIKVVPADGLSEENCLGAKEGICGKCGFAIPAETAAALSLKRDAVAELCFRL